MTICMSKVSRQPVQGIPEKVWQTGEVVLLMENILFNKMSTVGIVYLVVNHKGVPYVSILLESGSDLGMIETENICNSYLPVGQIDLNYEFSSADQLMEDFIQGRFSTCFECAKQYATA